MWKMRTLTDSGADTTGNLDDVMKDIGDLDDLDLDLKYQISPSKTPAKTRRIGQEKPRESNEDGDAVSDQR